MSLYSDYLKERNNVEMVEHEFGFVTYRQIDKDTVYTIDVYIHPEHRREGLATKLGEMVEEKAKELGCNKIIGSIDVNANGVTESMRFLVNIGYQFSHINGNGLYFLKEI